MLGLGTIRAIHRPLAMAAAQPGVPADRFAREIVAILALSYAARLGG
jgi:hypothetical protein